MYEFKKITQGWRLFWGVDPHRISSKQVVTKEFGKIGSGQTWVASGASQIGLSGTKPELKRPVLLIP